eukprot:5066544-Lingulodinium_polyedra.AAC.1
MSGGRQKPRPQVRGPAADPIGSPRQPVTAERPVSAPAPPTCRARFCPASAPLAGPGMALGQPTA